MQNLIDGLVLVLDVMVDTGAVVLEIVGVIIVFISAVKALICYAKRQDYVRLVLADGLATALEFFLGGEILHTIAVRDLSDLLIIAGIVALRIALAFLIHWEIKTETAHQYMESAEADD